MMRPEDLIAILQEHVQGADWTKDVDLQFTFFVAGWMCSDVDFNAERFTLIESENTLEQALYARFVEFLRQRKDGDDG